MRKSDIKNSPGAVFNKNKIPRIRTTPMPADAYQEDIIMADWVVAHMDIAGGAAAYEHVQDRVVTVGVEAMSFHKPVRVGDDVSIYTDISFIGRTSIGIKMEAWSRNRNNGEATKVTEGLFTFVALDKNGRPRIIPDRENYPELPKRDIKAIQEARADSQPMKDLPEHLSGEQPARRLKPLPKDRNMSGDIFGGWILAQMDKASIAQAEQLTGQTMVPVGMQAMTFHKPVHVGDDISFFAKIENVGNTSISLKVESWALRQKTRMYEKVTEGVFTSVAIDKDKNPVPLTLKNTNRQDEQSGIEKKGPFRRFFNRLCPFSL